MNKLFAADKPVGVSLILTDDVSIACSLAGWMRYADIMPFTKGIDTHPLHVAKEANVPIGELSQRASGMFQQLRLDTVMKDRSLMLYQEPSLTAEKAYKKMLADPSGQAMEWDQLKLFLMQELSRTAYCQSLVEHTDATFIYMKERLTIIKARYASNLDRLHDAMTQAIDGFKAALPPEV